MPRFVKRRSTFRRRTKRTRGRSTKSSALVTKSYLKKTLARTIESKRNTVNSSLNRSDEIFVKDRLIGEFITPGVTDEGRIGNTIHLTGITCRYVFSARRDFDNTSVDTNSSYPPVTLKMYIVQMKNSYYLPTAIWYKSFDAGNEVPYVPLLDESISDGRRVLNTDNMTVLGSYTKTLQPTADESFKQHTGSFSVRFKKHKKLVFNTNSLTTNGLAEIAPPLWLVYYFYLGVTDENVDATLDYGARVACTTYYKDT